MKINGQVVNVSAEPTERLLDYVRDDLGLTGAKEGCGMGECGACTVLVDGRPVCSCLVLIGQVREADIVTAEGLAAAGFGELQEALVENNASQCGYCTPGMAVSAAAIVSRLADPDEEAIRQALAGNLCRCTGYGAIVKAVQEAARGAGRERQGK